MQLTRIDHSNFWRKHMQMYKTLVLFFSLGTHSLVSANPTLLKEAGQTVSPSGIECRKETGGKKRLRKWSRGHQFIVRAGGHIDAWQPLYK